MAHLERVLVTLSVLLLASTIASASLHNRPDDTQPLSHISIHRQLAAVNSNTTISVTPGLLGTMGESWGYVTVTFSKPSGANASDWIGVFSPANFDGSQCLADLNLTYQGDAMPYLCSAPVKFQYANHTSKNYTTTGTGSLTFRLINQRYDYAFGFFSGGISKPVLEAMSKAISFKNPNAPLYPRLAVGESWDEMTVTWSSGYSMKDARPVVMYKWVEDANYTTILAITKTYKKSDMCGPPASTIGWRDPGYFHTGFMKGLWPSAKYYYLVGHKLASGGYVWGTEEYFVSSPFPGEESPQRVVIFGDMGKKERDGSTEYADNQAGALNVTDALVSNLENIDLVVHNGDIVYANGYISQWDQYMEQVSNITKRVPWMLSSGNHERDWPGTSSFYQNQDSGGECGGPTETSFYMPTKNKDKFWYEFSWGLFHFCVGDSEEDWRIGSEQWLWLEKCFQSVDRRSQPWSIFMAHRVLGYSSADEYQAIGTLGEPMARDHLQQLWQRYKVDLAIYGHVHLYERTCPVYENNCVPLSSTYTNAYSGQFNATIHIVAGTGGQSHSAFGPSNTTWSVVKDISYGYVLLTSSDSSTLKVEYKHSNDNTTGDSFTISRQYPDVLGCDASSSPECMPTTTADLA